MPKTKLLLTHYETVIGSFDSYYSIAQHLGITIDAEGTITFMGVRRAPKYILKTHDDQNGFTPVKALRNWAANYMVLPKGYHIYRYIV